MKIWTLFFIFIIEIIKSKSDKMNENKIDQINHINQIIKNRMNIHSKTHKMHLFNTPNIITHQLPNHSAILSNPEEPYVIFSARKSIPKNTQVIRERSEMIVHPSKISKDVPGWFKGETYKYYNRSEYNQLNKRSFNTLDNSRNLIGTIQHHYNRSQISTPRSKASRGSSQDDVFYLGGRQREPYMRRISFRKQAKEIAPKIGSIDYRNFELPKIPVKVGKQDYINTHRAF